VAVPQKKQDPADVMEGLIIQGDLSGLTPDQRVIYYNRVCESIGVNPLTQPFQYLKLQGKLILYATRACADQLRKLHGIDIEIVSQDINDGLLTVHARAKDRDGRVDEDLGVVPFPDTLRGEVRANTILRAVTKAKRRVTLSISGLGYLDETEAESIPGAEKVPPKPAVALKPANGTHIDAQTGEITETTAPVAASQGAVDAAPPEETPPDGGAVQSIEDQARAEARRGAAAMRTFWLNCTPEEQARVHKIRPEINKLVDAAEEAEGNG
jgi:hypothetical protein